MRVQWRGHHCCVKVRARRVFQQHWRAICWTRRLAVKPYISTLACPILNRMETAKIVDAYKHATKRLLLLDYDGVLAPIVPLPEQAMPSKKMFALLEKLTADTRNTCVVVSGRDHETLDEWLGNLPLAFAAEHGLWRRDSQG